MDIKNVMERKIRKAVRITGIPVYRFKEALNAYPELEKIKTAEEARNIYFDYPENSNLKQTALLERWIDLSKTAKEIQEPCIFYVLLSETSKFHYGWDKWDKFSLKEIEVAKTIKAIRAAHYNCSHTNEVEKAAICKWLSICSSEKEAAEVYNKCRTPEDKKTALVRIYELTK